MAAGAAILLLALIAIVAVLLAPSDDDANETDDDVGVPAPRDGDEIENDATAIAEKERA